MKELLLRNLISDDRRKKEILLSESCERKGCLQRLEKKSVYIVRDIMRMSDNFDLKSYLDQKKNEGLLSPKQTYIIKSYDTKKSQDKFTYKVWGDLYAILDDKVYLVRLMQYLKLEFTRAKK